MRKLFLFLFLLLSMHLFSQKGIIEGFINDKETHIPLSGANININKELKGDNTDQFGKFRIHDVTPGHYELIATHIGYKTEIIPVEVKAHLTSTISYSMKKANLDLAEVRVNGKINSSLNTLGSLDIMLRPVNSSQDVLRVVPGLFIAQHAGGGKAEQIFLRGFDIDHGTDINIVVDGMPVNMLSHAHGQGYADLHFLIPETVEKINFDKGPYFTNKGNQATAGFVEFQTKEFLKENSIKLEAGRYNTQRAVGLLKIYNKEADNLRRQLFVATEYYKSDNYFDSPQNFHRFNLMGKYNAWLGNQTQFTITASIFDSKWDASGQIPERAVKRHIINRFGSIDDSEGGNTGRANLNFRISKQWKNNWKTISQLYYSRYHFDLFSNFTFFLNDTINGDGINQQEKRNLFGFNNTASKSWMLGNKNATTEFSTGFRYDDIRNIELSRTVKRQFIESLQKGNVKETNGFFSWNQNLELSNKLSINGGLRFDAFRFAYLNLLEGEKRFQQRLRSIVSPKLNFVYTASPSFKIYLNNGIGFHSNDSRVILNNQAKDILPKVYGTDLGIILKPVKKLILKAALWQLYSQQEFVYVGDAGIVEPSGRSKRKGIDFSARYQFHKWLYADLDLNFTKARTTDAAKGENFIPLAAAFTSIGGLTAKLENGLNASIRYRFIGDRPADETNTIIAKGYMITDLQVNYSIRKMEFAISADNLFNKEWREAQFNTESKLTDELNPVSEIHFTPGSPRFLKFSLAFKF